MSVYQPAQVYASVGNKPIINKSKKQDTIKEAVTPLSRENEIQVSATGEMSVAPDRCRVTITVNSIKDEAQEAKNSVFPRVDYIVQTLANHQIRVSNYHPLNIIDFDFTNQDFKLQPHTFIAI